MLQEINIHHQEAALAQVNTAVRPLCLIIHTHFPHRFEGCPQQHQSYPHSLPVVALTQPALGTTFDEEAILRENKRSWAGKAHVR